MHELLLIGNVLGGAVQFDAAGGKLDSVAAQVDEGIELAARLLGKHGIDGVGAAGGGGEGPAAGGGVGVGHVVVGADRAGGDNAGACKNEL